jgi:hypothetical protein
MAKINGIEFGDCILRNSDTQEVDYTDDFPTEYTPEPKKLTLWERFINVFRKGNNG